MTETVGANARTAPLTPDICVLGAGPGGFSVASAAALFGVSVVLIDCARPGAARSQTVAAAQQALAAAADSARAVEEARHFGFATGDAAPDFARVQAHVARVGDTLSPNHSFERLGALGVRVLTGEARFTSRNALIVGDTTVRARRFVLAMDSLPALPGIAGLAELSFLTEDSLGALTRRPERLIVLGGGAAAIESAQAMRSLGSEVILVSQEALLAKEDPEAVGILRRALLHDGIALFEGVAVMRAEGSRNHPRLVLAAAEGGVEQVVEGSHLLVATGRRCDLEALDLDIGGIRSEAGRVIVDRGLRTSNRRVLALGDCVSDAPAGPRSAHIATHQAGLVLRNLLFRQPIRLQASAVPRLIRCTPELASIGLSEAEARAKGDFRVLRLPYGESERAQAAHRTQGMLKLITDAKGHVLGVTIIGERAGDLLAPWCLAVQKKLGVADMAEINLPSPSFSELSKRLALSFHAPLTARPGLRRLIGFLQRFG